MTQTGSKRGAAAAAAPPPAAAAVADLLQRHEASTPLPRCIVFDLDYTVGGASIWNVCQQLVGCCCSALPGCRPETIHPPPKLIVTSPSPPAMAILV